MIVRHKGDAFVIDWPTAPIPRAFYDALAAEVKSSADYSANTEAAHNMLRDVNANVRTNVPLEQAISLRHVLLKAKIIGRYGVMNRIIASVTRKHNKGMDILELSQKYDFPPLSLLRGILLHRGMDATKVYHVFADKVDPGDVLFGRDLQQYKAAAANDAESCFDQQVAAVVAAQNEAKFIDRLRAEGIRIRTQEDLMAEQQELYGRSVATPDVLFEDVVIINGRKITWIDYKDYAGTDVHFLHSASVKQVQRYEDRWGMGALCYGRSFVEDLTVSGAMLLDTSALY